MTDHAMTLRMTAEQHDRLKIVAHEQGTSITEVVRIAIERHLTSTRHVPKPTGSNGMRYCYRCKEIEPDLNGICTPDRCVSDGD